MPAASSGGLHMSGGLHKEQILRPHLGTAKDLLTRTDLPMPMVAA